MGGFSRYLDPGGEGRDVRPAPMGAFDEQTTSAPPAGYINERAFAAALPPVDDNLLPRKGRGQLLEGFVPGGRS
jgi:hypothetical protein